MSDYFHIIGSFDNDYAFLSNFYPCSITFNGRTFSSSEAAFQAQKCIDELEKDKFININASTSKKLGRKVKLRPDWEYIKDYLMLQIVREKFKQNPELAAALLATGNAYLCEGNHWKDKHWGICPEVGHPGSDGLNMLGSILMIVRAELRYQKSISEVK